jgi:hypothetical protein
LNPYGVPNRHINEDAKPRKRWLRGNFPGTSSVS